MYRIVYVALFNCYESKRYAIDRIENADWKGASEVRTPITRT